MNTNELAIDLNLDAGESEAALVDGTEDRLYQLVSSVNIACGGHAGNSDTMARAIELALKYKLKIGAHPSFPDRRNFGRKMMNIDSSELTDTIRQQLADLETVCRRFGATLTHIKPHGALYNAVAEDGPICSAFINSVTDFKKRIKIVGLAGSAMISRMRTEGFAVYEEGFADRAYESATKLRSRNLPGALFEKVEDVSAQAVDLVFMNRVCCFNGEYVSLKIDTLCIHGDHPKALEFALAVNRATIRR